MDRLDPTETCYVLGRVGKESRDRWFCTVADIASAHDDLVKDFDETFLSRLRTAANIMLQLVRADLCVELQTDPNHRLAAKYNAQIAIAQGILCRLKKIKAYVPTFIDGTVDVELSGIIRLSIVNCKANAKKLENKDG